MIELTRIVFRIGVLDRSENDARVGILVLVKQIVAAFALILTACASSDEVRRAIRLDIPPELESIEPIPVKRSFNRVGKKPLSFGEYRVVDHRFPTTKRQEADAMAAVAELSASREQKLYRFELENPANARWTAECKSTASGLALRTPSGRSEVEITDFERFDCTFKNGSRQWRLEMKYGPRAALSGDLMSGDEAILIRPVEAQAGPLRIPGGYMFSLDKRPLAALSVVEPGSIRFDPTLSSEHRDVIAAAASALLLNAP
jgi:hypothetical protein